MRIGIDIRATQFTVSGQRGFGSYVASMVEGLLTAASPHDFVLFVLPGLPLPERITQAVRTTRCRIVPLPTALVDDNSLLGRLRGIWRLHYLSRGVMHRWQLSVAVRRHHLDVIHIAVPFDQWLFSDIETFLQGRCRVVKTAYDLIPLIMQDQYFGAGTARMRFSYERQLRAYRHADSVVAISASAGEDFVRLAGVDSSRVRVVPCGVPEYFVPSNDTVQQLECLERFGLSPRYFLFCSGPGPNKNRGRVMEAFGRFLAARADRNVQLVFTGPDYEPDMKGLKLIAFDGHVRPGQLRVLGFVPTDDLVTLFRGAIALVTPSLYEGFGLPAAQAMRTGTPVIASDRSSHPEVVGDAGLLVDPLDVDAIADAMTRLADDQSLRERLVARGLERGRRFTLTAQTDLLLKVYEELESSPRAMPELSGSLRKANFRVGAGPRS